MVSCLLAIQTEIPGKNGETAESLSYMGTLPHFTQVLERGVCFNRIFWMDMTNFFQGNTSCFVSKLLVYPIRFFLRKKKQDDSPVIQAVKFLF